MTIKVDLEKAFDRLKWSFIEETLKDVGFPEATINLIMHCITSPPCRSSGTAIHLRPSGQNEAYGKVTQSRRISLSSAWNDYPKLSAALLRLANGTPLRWEPTTPTIPSLFRRRSDHIQLQCQAADYAHPPSPGGLLHLLGAQGQSG